MAVPHLVPQVTQASHLDCVIRLPSRLVRLARLAAAAASRATAVKSSVVAGVAVANKLGSAALLDAVRYAFVQGMDTMLWVCGGIALVSAILAFLFLPRRAEGGPAGAGPVASGESGSERAELEV